MALEDLDGMTAFVNQNWKILRFGSLFGLLERLSFFSELNWLRTDSEVFPAVLIRPHMDSPRRTSKTADFRFCSYLCFGRNAASRVMNLTHWLNIAEPRDGSNSKASV